MRPRALVATALLLLAPRVAVGAPPPSPQAPPGDPVPSLDLRGFTAPIDPGSGVYVQPADSPATGEWSAGVWTQYAYRPVALRDAQSHAIVLDVVRHQISSDLVAAMGLWHRLVVGFDLPVVVYQTGDAPGVVGAQALGGPFMLPRQAFGDLGLDAKLTIVRPTAGDRGGFALALHERLSLPTGDTSSSVGEGAVSNEARLLAEYRLAVRGTAAALGLHGALGVKLRGHYEDFACDSVGSGACATRFGHEIPFGLGVSLLPRALGLDDKGHMTWFLEMNGHLPAAPIAPFRSTAASSLQIDLAARFALGADVSLLTGVEAGFLGLGDAPVRGILSIAWAPRVHDRDGDGIPDDVDRCPDLPEDFDGFEDHDGCPENDNDGDGIPDKLDQCPNTPEDKDGYQDADGCPDPDNDGDRIPDVEDACPNVPGPPDPDPKRNGCPIGDRDGDGIPDDKDACPDTPGPASANPKLHGCPHGGGVDDGKG